MFNLNITTMNTSCPKTADCKLFNNNLLSKPEYAETYRSLFCNAGEKRWTQCKRFIVAGKFGKCPDYVLPNSIMTLDEVEARMKKEKFIY